MSVFFAQVLLYTLCVSKKVGFALNYILLVNLPKTGIFISETNGEKIIIFI